MRLQTAYCSCTVRKAHKIQITKELLQSTIILTSSINLLLRPSDCPNIEVLSPHLGLGCQFTAGVQLALLSSGSAHWAIWHRGDATHASPLTGRSAAGPGCRCTALGGCRRCRRPPHQSDGRGGWGLWCALACCFYSALWEWKCAVQLFVNGLVRYQFAAK